MHEQVNIKVNARSDKGIAPLVEVLSEIVGCITLDSCQEGAFGEAYVFFTYGKTWQELALLLQTISTELSEIKLDVGYLLRLEWLGSNERPRAQAVLSPEHVATLTRGIWTVLKKINRHMSESIGDKSRITLHS